MSEDLSEEVWAVIGVLALIAMLLLFLGEPLKRHEFVTDCSDKYSKEECLEMWEMGNE